jgi:hypothetical protein
MSVDRGVWPTIFDGPWVDVPLFDEFSPSGQARPDDSDFSREK